HAGPMTRATLPGCLLVAPLAAALLLTSPAAASGSEDVAAAEATFNEGKKLAAAGRYAEACPKFAESQRLDPGAGTLLNYGDCLEKLGKVASAWGAFREAVMLASRVGDEKRRVEATRRADLLEPRLSRLTIVVPPAGRVKGLEVHRDE